MKKNIFRYIFFICAAIYFSAIYIFAALADSISKLLISEGEITRSILSIPIIVILSAFYIVVSFVMLYGVEHIKAKSLISRTIWISTIILAIAFYFLNSNPFYNLIVLTAIVMTSVQANIYLWHLRKR